MKKRARNLTMTFKKMWACALWRGWRCTSSFSTAARVARWISNTSLKVSSFSSSQCTEEPLSPTAKMSSVHRKKSPGLFMPTWWAYFALELRLVFPCHGVVICAMASFDLCFFPFSAESRATLLVRFHTRQEEVLQCLPEACGRPVVLSVWKYVPKQSLAWTIWLLFILCNQ